MTRSSIGAHGRGRSRSRFAYLGLRFAPKPVGDFDAMTSYVECAHRDDNFEFDCGERATHLGAARIPYCRAHAPKNAKPIYPHPV